MRIATKKGDQGKTALYPRGTVAKDSPRIELVGALDELNAFLGVSRCLLKDKMIRQDVKVIQRDLFLLGAEAVTSVVFLKKLKKRIGVPEVDRLESMIAALEKRLSAKKFCFSVPGGTLVSGSLDVARTICRRAERRAVGLSRKKLLKNPQFLIYLNRLSDVLFLLARARKNKP